MTAALRIVPPPVPGAPATSAPRATGGSPHDQFDLTDCEPAAVRCACCGGLVRDLRVRCADCRDRTGDTPEAARYHLLVDRMRRLT